MKTFALVIVFYLCSECSWSGDFSASVKDVSFELDGHDYQLSADINYNLSPTVNEALKKGVPLTWVVIVRVEQEAFLFDTTLKEVRIKYQIQNHALLNLFSVKKNGEAIPDMFSSQAAALNFMSKIHIPAMIEQQFIQSDRYYHIAIKIVFIHEALPVLLRPLSYFDPQWDLSSRWIIWRLFN